MHNLRRRLRTIPQVMHRRHAEGTEGERRSRRHSSRQIRLSQVRRRVTINHRAVAIAEGSLRFMDREETQISSPASLFVDSTFSFIFFVTCALRNPRMLWFCQSVAFAISAMVAP